MSSTMTSSRQYIVLASSSVAVAVCYCLLQRRARKRAQDVAENAQKLVKGGVMIDCSDETSTKKILDLASKRATKWISLYHDTSTPEPMLHQVGGARHCGQDHVMLSLKPDCILKPLPSDARGVREVAFYEAIRFARSRSSLASYLMEHQSTVSSPQNEALDVIAMWLVMKAKDPVVASYENSMVRSWRLIKQEAEQLHRLSMFVPAYYGVVENPLRTTPSGPKHILMHDVTANFGRPCIMDIKMGTRTSEPDATVEKKEKEQSKYPQQKTFGLRIVGMRRYDPASPQSDEHGYVMHDKHYGRSLTTFAGLMKALRLFFRDTATTTAKTTNTSSTTHKIKTRCLANVNMQLRLIKQWFDDSNTMLRFYASSILIVYDAEQSNQATVKIVDFGHVRREQGGDPGFKHGLHTLMGLLDEILRQENARKFV